MRRRDYHSDYLYKFLNPSRLSFYIALAVQALEGWEFDTIAFRGMSGALIAPSVAIAMKKQLIMVRKTMSCHSDSLVEGYKEAKRYVILDDFTSSHTTRDTIIKEVSNFAPQAIYLGLLPVHHIDQQVLAYCLKHHELYPFEADLGQMDAILDAMEAEQYDKEGAC